jgi:hypothetical protein
MATRRRVRGEAEPDPERKAIHTAARASASTTNPGKKLSTGSLKKRALHVEM